jgi:hypothetical protein
MEPTPQKSVSIQAQWVLNPGEIPAVFNQILIQPGSTIADKLDGCYLTFGHVAPPVIPDGLSQEQLEDYSRVNVLPVTPVGRYFVTLDRLTELRDTIDDFLAKNREGDAAEG